MRFMLLLYVTDRRQPGTAEAAEAFPEIMAFNTRRRRPMPTAKTGSVEIRPVLEVAGSPRT